MLNVALPIDLHKNQQIIHDSAALNIVVMSGKRFGKTDFALYKLIKEAFKRPGGKYWYIAPTYGMAEGIAWSRLRELLPKHLIKRCVENKLMFELVTGSVIQLKGADNVDSLRGKQLHGVIFDEAAYMNPYIWNNIIRGQLLGVGGEDPGFAIFISSPVNPLETIGKKISDWYEKFYQEAMRKKLSGDTEWDAFHFTIYDNPLLSEKAINDIKADSTEDNFNVEYLAKPSAHSSQVFSEFEYSKHVKDEGVKALSLFIRGVDWGIDHPTVCLFGQVDVQAHRVHIEDEYVQAGYTIDESVEVIKRKTGSRVVDWTVCDPSLNKRNSQTGRTDKQEFDRLGVFCVPGDNNHRGYNIVKMFLKRGMLTVSPKCKNLIKQFRDLQWTDKTGDDCTDTVRYMAVRLHDLVWNGIFDREKEKDPVARPYSFNMNDWHLFANAGKKPETPVREEIGAY
jgi:hypothetical protein